METIKVNIGMNTSNASMCYRELNIAKTTLIEDLLEPLHAKSIQENPIWCEFFKNFLVSGEIIPDKTYLICSNDVNKSYKALSEKEKTELYIDEIRNRRMLNQKDLSTK